MSELKLFDRKVSDLIPYAKNPRKNDGAVDAVAASIRQFGFKVPIIIDRDNVIVAGHTRLKAAQKLGMESVPCIIADDLTDEQIRAFRLADNKTAELAEWDFDLLAAELKDLPEIDMSEFGFDTTDIPEADGAVYEDDYEEPEKIPPRSKPGDMFRLGDHTLMCGDSTDPEAVSRLVGGGYINLCVTDPPYNVDVSNSAGMTIQNDSLPEEKFIEFLTSAFRNMEMVLSPGSAFYIWYAAWNEPSLRAAYQAAGLQVREQLIWVKNAFSFGRSDYQWRHEPCLYGWKDGAAHYFTDSRSETTVIDDTPDLEHISKAEAVELLKAIYSNAATTAIYEKKPMHNTVHPTMKPVALIGYLISNSSRRGEKVLDLFGGSGTTMIACEQLGRKCFMMEYDPHYCDVIIDRWEAFTGRKAEILNGQV